MRCGVQQPDQTRFLGWLSRRLVLWLLVLVLIPALARAGTTTDHRQLPAPSPSPPVLTLDDVIRLALQSNRNVIGSTYGVESQELSVETARSAFEWKVFPNASAGATDETQTAGAGVTVEKRFTPGPRISVGPRLVRSFGDSDLDTTSEELSASLTVPLLRGFGSEINLSDVRSAEYALRSAARSHSLTKINTVLEAVADAYDIVQQRELVNLYSSQVERFKNHAVMAATRKNIGLASPIDIYRAEIRLRDARSSLSRAEENLRNAADRLKVVLAAPLEQTLSVTAPLSYQPLDISLDQAVETALANRIELKQSQEDLAEYRRLSEVARDNLNPNLDLVAGYVRSQFDERFIGTLEPDEEFWSISLRSTTDWSRTAEKAAYKQSLLAVKQVRLNHDTRVESVKREVRQYYEALLKAREQIQIRDEQIGQAGGKLALAKIKFSHGMADNFDVIESETELQQATANLLAAKIDYIVGSYRLRAALGTLIGS